MRARYGADHLPDAPRAYGKASKNAQEAHEAIRPAGVEMRTADELGLRDRDAALYDLVWKRAVASQMADARLRFVTARIEGRGGDRVAAFRATGRTTVFAGFQRAYVEGSDDPDAALDAQQQPLPALRRGDELEPVEVAAAGHETKPPARFTEATLVKALEEKSIGRPSTYASILDTIQQRRYVRKVGSQLVPTFTGFATNALLEHQFPHLVDERFTAKMEDDLDAIAQGTAKRVPYLDAIYAGPNGIATLVAVRPRRRGRARDQHDRAPEVGALRRPRRSLRAVRGGRDRRRDAQGEPPRRSRAGRPRCATTSSARCASATRPTRRSPRTDRAANRCS